MESEAERKESLRTEVWRRRRAMSPEERAVAGALLASHGLAWAAETVPAGGTLTAYLGVGAEPPTLGLLGLLAEGGFHVLLPVCEPERQLSWVEWRPDIEYARSRFAPLQEPVGLRLDAPAVRAGAPGRPPLAAVLLPATAVDAEGRRLGQGGGYYDRFLARLDDGGARIATAAIVYDDEVLASGGLPEEAFDRHVDAAITPNGLHRLGSPAE
ncbi:5-formyltetrahydrofolate cyclo-ligase [Sinomonas sp. G460-2]|uniref:5-formyltetrahydrofolate cyclo-ligase n=1 Tax=Sinomonas sp. G460-2 TaxID=3393464 RepID=UPI0039F0F062